VADANAVYDTYRQKLYDTFIQAGKTAEEAQILVDKWLALSQLADIDKWVNIHQNTYRATYGPDAPTYGAGFQEFAEGGYVKGPYPGAPVMVEAHVGELVQTVQQQQAQQWNGGGVGGGTVRQEHVVNLLVNGRQVRQLLITDSVDRNVSPTQVQVAYP